MTVLSQAT